ncbi:MAG: hypothetical protein ACFE9D_11650 [Promethearchaeota archaeon]
MEDSENENPTLWTPGVIILMMIMAVLFLITIYFGYILSLLWAVGLGLIWGIGATMTYYLSQVRTGFYRFTYAIQVILSFAIIIVFVSLQGIFGVHPQLFDILLLAITAVFSGGLLMAPFYKYSRIKSKSSGKSEPRISK